MNPLFSIARFNALALWRGHRALCVATGLVSLAVFGSALAVAAAMHAKQVATEELSALRAAKKLAETEAVRDQPRESQRQAELLPRFVSYEFTQQFHALATSTGVPVDEVGYVLEAGENKPYLRYRVNLAVKTRYLDVRKFIAALAADMPHITLDSIQCNRENAAVLPLTCQLSFSAFFSKA